MSYDLANGAISNDLDWSLSYISRFRGQTQSRGLSATAELLVCYIMMITSRTASCCDAVMGCGTPPAPAGGWLRRLGDKLTLGCNYTASMTWSLECVDSQWLGNTYNCSIPGILTVTRVKISLDVGFAYFKPCSATVQCACTSNADEVLFGSSALVIMFIISHGNGGYIKFNWCLSFCLSVCLSVRLFGTHIFRNCLTDLAEIFHDDVGPSRTLRLAFLWRSP